MENGNSCKSYNFLSKLKGFLPKVKKMLQKLKLGKYLRNSRKFAEAPQNCSETKSIFVKIQEKLAESPKMFAKI